jgi:hypothetical protein
MRRGVAAVALAGLLICLTGCVSPARDQPQYRQKAVQTLEAAAGEVATSLLALEQYERRKTFSAYADEVITSDENTAGSISTAFGSVQPPDHTSDEVRKGVMTQLSAAGDAIADARIAVRREDKPGMRTAADELRSAANGLEALKERLL